MSISPRSTYFILLIAPIFLMILLYYFSFNYSFFQDDFFHINISKASNLVDFINFFKFRNDIVGYRPITVQIYFFSLHHLFGLNSLFFKAFNILIFSASYLIAFKLVSNITGNKTVGILASFLWVTASFHFMTLAWISAAYQLIGTLFYLLAFLFFIEFKKRHNRTYYLFSLIIFIASLGSFEFAVTWPVIAFLYIYIFSKTRMPAAIKLISPFIVITALYIILRVLFKSTPQVDDYNAQITFSSLKTYFWYFLWLLNIPDEFKYQATRIIIPNSMFLANFWKLALKTYAGVVILLLAGIILPWIKFKHDLTKIDIRIIVFAVLWFSISILPVLFFPRHTYLMYLTLPSIGIYLLLAYFLVKSRSLWLQIIFITVWLFTSAATIDFYKTYSYMNEAQSISKRFTIEIKNKFPTLPRGSIVLYQLTNPAHVQALSNQNAIRAIYSDSTITIYYNKDQLIAESANIKKRQIFIFPPGEITLENTN